MSYLHGHPQFLFVSDCSGMDGAQEGGSYNAILKYGIRRVYIILIINEWCVL